jgi:hypothetical protein
MAYMTEAYDVWVLPQTFEDLSLFLNAFNARFNASLNDLNDLNMKSVYL